MSPSSFTPDPARPVVDPRKLENLKEEQWAKVVRYFEPECRTMCGSVLSDDQAEGVLHDTYLYVYRCISEKRIDDDTAFWNTMFDKAKCLKIDAIRKMRAKKRDVRKTISLDDPELDIGELPGGNEASGDTVQTTCEAVQKIRDHIAKLSEIHRGPAEAYLFEHLSQKQIAKKYDITSTNAGARLSRAHKNLTKSIRKTDPDLADRVSDYWSRKKKKAKK